MALGAGELAGFALGIAGAMFFLVCVLFYGLRAWLQGPLTGSNNPKRLDGKVVAITGASNGIGRETAKDLARRGAKVLFLVRSAERGRAAIREIQAECGVDEARMVMHLVDLSSLASVRNCAQSVLASEEKLDILINNAGVMLCPQVKTEDALDIQLATNHFGHFLLTGLLLPLLRASAAVSGFRPRIVIVSSMAHARFPMRWHDLNWNDDERHFSSVHAYCQSKLANLLHAKELAKRLEAEGTPLSVYCVHPGIVATDLLNTAEGSNCLFRCIGPFLRKLVKTPLHGAQTSIYCALDDQIETQSGRYYADCKETAPHRRALKEDDWKRLWEISEELVGLNSA